MISISASRPATLPERRPVPDAWLLGLAAVVLSLVEAPVLVGFGLSVVAAVAWCWWADRWPDAPDESRRGATARPCRGAH